MGIHFRAPRTAAGGMLFSAPVVGEGFIPRTGFGIAVMGADVSVEPDSVWYECVDGSPVEGAQIEYPLLSRYGAAVSISSRGVPSLDYAEVTDAHLIVVDYIDNLRSWSEGVMSEPVTKSIIDTTGAVAHSVSASESTAGAASVNTPYISTAAISESFSESSAMRFIRDRVPTIKRVSLRLAPNRIVLSLL